jgi:inosine-uridine nucleoside N-ribohydrolase
VEIAGRTDVPVAAGASHPLVRRLATAGHVHGVNGLAGVDFPEPKTKPVRETAPEIIRRIVRENPGEITIVAVGPLTNVALALRADPELAGMVPAIAIMGGSLSGGNMTPAAEFNSYVDPEAARIVFDANIPLTMVGLDVTRKCLVSEQHIKQLEAANNPVSQAAGKILRATYERMRHGGEVTDIALHDALAVASLIDPGVITRKDYYVEVETVGEWTAGQTLGYDGHGPIRKSQSAWIRIASFICSFRGSRETQRKSRDGHCDRTDPARILEQLTQNSHKRSDLSLEIAYIRADLGDRSQAFAWLR